MGSLYVGKPKNLNFASDSDVDHLPHVATHARRGFVHNIQAGFQSWKILLQNYWGFHEKGTFSYLCALGIDR